MADIERTVARLVELIELEEVVKKEVIKELHQKADELNVKTRDMSIAKTSFGAVGIVSSALTIGGIAAAPFTFGASLGLTITGAILGAVCGAGGAATHIAGIVIDKKTFKKAQEKYDKYWKLVFELGEVVERVKDIDLKKLEIVFKKLRRSASDENMTMIYNRIIGGLRDGIGVWKLDKESGLLSGSRVTASASHVGVVVAKTVADVVEGSVQALKIGGIVLSALTVPLDIYSIVSNSIKIHKKSPSKTSQVIRELADYLTNIAEEQENERARVIMRREREQALNTFHEAALKCDPANMAISDIKFYILLFHIYGIFLIIISAIIGSGGFLSFGISVMIVMQVGILFLELWIQVKSISMWANFKPELNDIICQNFSGGQDQYDYSSVVKLFHEFKQIIEHGDYVLNSSRDFVLISLKCLLDLCCVYYTFSTISCTSEVAVVSTGLIPLDGALTLIDAANPNPQCRNPRRALVFLLTAFLSLYILAEMVAERYWGKKSRFRQEVHKVVEQMRAKLAEIFGVEPCPIETGHPFWRTNISRVLEDMLNWMLEMITSEAIVVALLDGFGIQL